MEGTVHDDQASQLSHQEEDDRINTDNDVEEVKNQGTPSNGNDSRLIQQGVANQTYSSAIPMPMMIPIRNGSNRNDVVSQQMSNLVSQPIRNSFYSQPIMNTYAYAGNNQMSYGSDLPNGTGSISLAPVNPIQSMNQNSNLPIQNSIGSFASQDIRMHNLDGDNVINYSIINIQQRMLPGFFLSSFLLKPIEELSLADALDYIERDSGQVTQSTIIKLISTILNDNERSSFSKDENYLHQSLQVFLQQHQEFAVRNTVCDEVEISKKAISYDFFESLYMNFLQKNAEESSIMNSDISKDPVRKVSGNVADIPWNGSRSYTGDVPFGSVMMGSKTIRNPRPGKPTVLTGDEEMILSNYILQLEERQIRLPREDVKKIVMGMLQALGRPHPFKDDGPHRHWFRGFYRRNPNILKTRSISSPAPREQLKEEQVQQFLGEMKRLDMNGQISLAAHNLQCAVYNESGYHFDFSSEGSLNTGPMPSFMHNNLVSQSSVDMDPSLSMLTDLKEEKTHRRAWTNEQLEWAIEQVTNGNLTLKDASERTLIPVATIRNHCRNPQMGARRGPPTVLTTVEEMALERFLLKLDDFGYKANKEELGKLVMELVNSDKREHPFKDDGPHRHWFQGFYRRHKQIASRKRASSSSLCRQEAPPEMMKRFFDELNELKSQQGDASEPRAKKAKLSQPIDVISLDTVPNQITMVDMPNPSMDPGPIVHTTNDVMRDFSQTNQSMITSQTFDQDLPAVKKGGRPKLPLFSVRPCRQKSRTMKVMQYIRDFAVENSENVDDILWSLLMLRVRGSGNGELYGDLEKMYQEWSSYVSSNHMDNRGQALGGVSPSGVSPSMQPMQNQQNQNMSVNILPIQQQGMPRQEQDFSIQAISIDHNDMLDTDQNDMITRV